MVHLGPFEPCPIIAVAVSGGPDSMALCHLIHDWTRARGGAAVGLTVNHGLRPESADEARTVAVWLAALGIAHHVLSWPGAKPTNGLQSAARDARYRLLADFCRQAGILHLAVAHHADDQAETVLFRRERGSGPTGLAGMAASRSLGAARLIRPLLSWRKEDLIATCRARGQGFVDDPSNRAPRFARTTMRFRLADDPALRTAVLEQAADMARTRALGQRMLDASLSRIVEIGPDGAARLDLHALSSLTGDDRDAVIGATLRAIGGNAFAPRPAAVARLGLALVDSGFRGGTLAGCVVRPWRGRVVVSREHRGTEAPIELEPGAWRLWDGRFEGRTDGAATGVTLGALGPAEYARLRKTCPAAPPAFVGASLPAIRMRGDLMAVPGLGWRKTDAPRVQLRFTPRWPLSSETFTVVNR